MSAEELKKIEKWGRFELELDGPREGNPYREVSLKGKFRRKNREVEVEGFYDGDGSYKLRFTPDRLGKWCYETISDREELDGRWGKFRCVEPSEGNHGPVRVEDKVHFAYADGSPYYPVGTTCYAWIHQKESLQEETLEELKESPFNKIRSCVFPKHYAFNKNEPLYHPFQKGEGEERDFSRPNPEFFRHLEEQVERLGELGIQLDLILFHPYDRWGYAEMGKEADDRYLRYVVARLNSYHNVWWSLANEYDLLEEKSTADWDRFFKIIQENDPVGHLRSIHNCREFYDHNKPWVTHLSVQSQDKFDVTDWREEYGKPVVVDECGYEGNNGYGWGSLPPKELIRRLWKVATTGGFPAAHGETYLDPDDVLWWSKGGKLKGESPKRIAFLREIFERAPAKLKPCALGGWDASAAGIEEDFYLLYFGIDQPARKELDLPSGHRYEIEVIDTWGMTVDPLGGEFSGSVELGLPGKPYQALRITRV